MCHNWLKKHVNGQNMFKTLIVLATTRRTTLENNKFYYVDIINGKLILNVRHMLSNMMSKHEK